MIQLLNVLEITDLFSYLDEINGKSNRTFGCFINLLTSPKELDAAILPRQIKTKAIQKLTDYISKCSSECCAFKGAAEQILQYLNQDQENNLELSYEKFIRFTDALDRSRNQNFKETFPDLNRMLTEDTTYARVLDNFNRSTSNASQP